MQWGCCELFFTPVSQSSWCIQPSCTSSLWISTCCSVQKCRCSWALCAMEALPRPHQISRKQQPSAPSWVVVWINIKCRGVKISSERAVHFSTTEPWCAHVTSVICFGKITLTGRPYQKGQTMWIIFLFFISTYTDELAYNWICPASWSAFSLWEKNSVLVHFIQQTVQPKVLCVVACLPDEQIQHFHKEEVELHSCKSTPSSTHMVEVSIQ